MKAQIAAPAQPQDLRLVISTGIPVGVAEALMGTNHIIQLILGRNGVDPAAGCGQEDDRIDADDRLPEDAVLETTRTAQSPGHRAGHRPSPRPLANRRRCRPLGLSSVASTARGT